MTATGHRDEDALAERLCGGERAAVAQALNLLDDRREDARESASALLGALAARSAGSTSHLIGITGPPGVGKSSLTASLICEWRARGQRVGVLAVDPSSPVSGGALLGDRLRMKTAGDDKGVFVRSLSSRGDFGGLAPEAWPMALAMLAAFDIVIVETVGVGQREIDVAATCDTTCFVAQPGSGDSIQFLKAGVLEVPHVMVVNKQDMGEVARRTLNELRTALGSSEREAGWQVPVIATSATASTGIAELADTLAEHRQLITPTLPARRAQHQAHWVVKRLVHGFGQAGLDRLGGEAKLLARLAGSQQDPLSLYRDLVNELN